MRDQTCTIVASNKHTAAHAVANVVMGLPLQPNPSKGLPFAVKHLPHWSKEQTLVPLQL